MPERRRSDNAHAEDPELAVLRQYLLERGWELKEQIGKGTNSNVFRCVASPTPSSSSSSSSSSPARDSQPVGEGSETSGRNHHAIQSTATAAAATTTTTTGTVLRSNGSGGRCGDGARSTRTTTPTKSGLLGAKVNAVASSKPVEAALKVVDIRGLRLHHNYQYKKERIWQEISIMRGVSHANIVHLFDTFEVDHKVCLLMERFEGEELYDLILRRKQLDEASARHVFRQLVQTIAYLHRRKIIHRDIKPENVLVDPSTLTIKLIDFGLSKVIASSMARSFVGTPEYFAPEVKPNMRKQAAFGRRASAGAGPKGQPVVESHYDCAADCWSLGIVLYVMLMGRFPSFYRKVATPQSRPLTAPGDNDTDRPAISDQQLGDSAMSFDSDVSDAPPDFGRVTARVALGACDNFLSEEAIELISGLLVEEPSRRLTAMQAAQSSWVALGSTFLRDGLVSPAHLNVSPLVPGRVTADQAHQGLALVFDEKDEDDEDDGPDIVEITEVTSTSTIHVRPNTSAVLGKASLRPNTIQQETTAVVEDVEMASLQLGPNATAASSTSKPELMHNSVNQSSVLESSCPGSASTPVRGSASHTKSSYALTLSPGTPVDSDGNSGVFFPTNGSTNRKHQSTANSSRNPGGHITSNHSTNLPSIKLDHAFHYRTGDGTGLESLMRKPNEQLHTAFSWLSAGAASQNQAPFTNPRQRSLSNDYAGSSSIDEARNETADMSASARQTAPERALALRSMPDIVQAVSGHFQMAQLSSQSTTFAPISNDHTASSHPLETDARECHNQLHDMQRLLLRLDGTAQSMGDAHGDLTLAMEEQIPDLAIRTFSMVKGWLEDLQEMTKRLHRENHAITTRLRERINRTVAVVVAFDQLSEPGSDIPTPLDVSNNEDATFGRSYQNTTCNASPSSSSTTFSSTAAYTEANIDGLRETAKQLQVARQILVKVGGMLGYLDMTINTLCRKTKSLELLVVGCDFELFLQ
eukprot:INCI450.1.p1 GENE.INCI450.1~~INCI450.1.p1  ORF type:complete len:981 (+),score=152.21 INCI450.1:150-3092(+)